MKNWKKSIGCIALFAFCVMSVSCSGDNDEPILITGQPSEPEQPVLSDVKVEAYYGGDYNEAGTGNLWINIAQGEFDIIYDEYDEIEGYVGSGSVLCIDLNQALAADPDKVKLEAGTYTIDTTGSFAEGTINAGESYLLKVADGAGVQQMLAAGSVTIAELGDLTYTIACDLTLNDGTKVSDTYTVLCRPINRSGEGIMSNLDKDVAADDLTQALFLYEGDLYETGESDMYIVILAAEDFDLAANYGLGNSLTLYMNVEPGSSTGIPSGTYDTFIDIEEAEGLPAGSCVSGLFYYGTYMGCWYFNMANQYEARLVGGSVEVENNAGTYTVRGTLKTADDRSVAFSYSGTPDFYDDAESFSVGTAGLQPRRLSKK